jgi:hypothetical protein
MRTNGKHEVVARIAAPGLVLGAVFALMLSSSSAGRAQASAASSAVPAATPAKAAPASQAAQAAATGLRKPGGNHEGITIHGHWTIEVRNPDGKLVTHREFENGLSANPGTGATLLSAMLGGAVTPGSWWVLITDPTLQQGGIFFNQANSAASTLCGPEVLHLNAATAGSPWVCSNTLSVTSAQLQGTSLSGAATVTLMGTGTVPADYSASTIGYAETDNLPCAPSNSASGCFSAQSPGIGQIPLTARVLNGAAGTATAPVPVAPLQTVSVTVVISFASGS